MLTPLKLGVDIPMMAGYSKVKLGLEAIWVVVKKLGQWLFKWLWKLDLLLRLSNIKTHTMGSNATNSA